MDLQALNSPLPKPWLVPQVDTLTAQTSVVTSPLSLGGVRLLATPGPETLSAEDAVSKVIVIPATYNTGVLIPLSVDVDAYLENKTLGVQYAIRIVNRSLNPVSFSNAENGGQTMPGITGAGQFLNGTIYMQRDLVTPGIYTALNQ